MKYIFIILAVLGLLTGGGIIAQDAITDYVDQNVGGSFDGLTFNDVSDRSVGELGATCTNTFPTSTNSYSSGDCIPSAWGNALETKIGIDNSSSTDSLDYLLKQHTQPIQLTVSGTSTLNGFTLFGGNASTTGTFKVITPSTDFEAANKTYVDTTVTGGGAVADTSTAGVGIFSSLSELQTGTATSSYDGTTYNLFPQNRYFDATPSATTTVPVTEADGDLNDGFIGQDQNYTWTGTTNWSGNQIFNTSTTMSTTTIDSDGTLTVNGEVSGTLEETGFGGDGSDGALDTSSATTIIDLSGSKVVVKNYTSINVATNDLQFSNAHASGTIVFLRSQGDVDITSTVNATGTGADGGASVSDTSAGNDGNSGNGFYLQIRGGNGGNDGVTAGGLGASAPTSTNYFALQRNQTDRLLRLYDWVVPGTAGGSGEAHGDGVNVTTCDSGKGGDSAGAIIIESGGDLNFTGTIDVSGQNGESGSASVSTDSSCNAAGGGGGSGGYAGLFYGHNTSLTNTGTSTHSGGTGGNNAADQSGGGNADGSEGGGGGANIFNDGNDGSTEDNTSNKNGGDGADGKLEVLESIY